MDRNLPVLLKRFSPANDLQTLSVQFTEIARAALYGGYFVVNKDEYHIYLLDIEFYFHSEETDGIHEPKMYHKGNLPFFPKGTLWPHLSGVDVTFEDDEYQKYRASFLIRGYKYIGKDGEEYINGTDDFHPQHLWEDLFGNASFLRPSGLTIKWQSNIYSEDEPLIQSARIRMPQYESENEPHPWRFSKK